MYVIVGLVVIGIVAVLASMGGSTTPPVVIENGTATTTATTTEMLNVTSTSQGTTTSSSASTAIKTYALADVAGHKDAASCWSIVNGGVYDLTSWIGKHPGGDKAILGICGKDGSSAFNSQHGGMQKQISLLATFKIGELAK